MTMHYLTAHCPIGNGTIPVHIEYTWDAGWRGDGPDAYNGPTPDEPDEVGFVAWHIPDLLHGRALEATGQLIADWCADYLLGEGYERACQTARSDVKARGL